MTAAVANLALPVRGRGRQTADAAAAYERAVETWCHGLKEIASTLEFKVSSRGWCYTLEEHGLAKGDFDKAQALIGDCRKAGLLPLDFCAEDTSRGFEAVERLDASSPEAEADNWIWTLQRAHARYTPISFWDDKDVFIQLLVEKVDLKSLFFETCQAFRIPIGNARGWADINARAAMMKRFAKAEAQGKQPVLLYCGDHDPSGLLIAESLRANFAELSKAVGWSPDRLVIDRFGLTREFIDRHGLTWIDGLKTGGGKDLGDEDHAHHGMAYVRDYIAVHGRRKVEANVLVTRPDSGRQLLLDAIHKYLPADAPMRYEASLDSARAALQRAIHQRLAEAAS